MGVEFVVLIIGLGAFGFFLIYFLIYFGQCGYVPLDEP